MVVHGASPELLVLLTLHCLCETQDVEHAVEELVFVTKATDVKLHSVLNEFMLLSNVQFVENVCL